MKILYRLSLIIFTAILILFTNLTAQAGGLEFSHITAEEGLSYNNVTQIFQDSRGFLWICTFNGLNRYDGYNFKVFLPDNSDPASISSQSISNILEDKEGYLWISTTDGLNKYNWKTETFERYKNNPQAFSSISNSLIYSIFEDDKGTIWIGTLNGLNKYNRDKDNFTVFKQVSNRLNPDSLNSVLSIEEDSRGYLWLATWNGLTCMKKNGEIIKTYFSQPVNSNTFEYRKISVIYKDKQNNFWIGMNGKGLKKFDPFSGEFTDYYNDPANPNTISNGFITAIYQDKSNKLWIGTRYGLNIFDPKNNNFIRMVKDPNKSSSIISNNISSIIEDKAGIIWIGTTAGISRLYHPLNTFHFYNEQNLLKNSSIISAFLDSKNNIWIGTMGGLDEIKNNRKSSTHFQHDPKNKNSLCDNFVRSVFVDKSGLVWIGSNNDGLNSYDPKTGKFEFFTYDMNDSASISNKGIVSICQDNLGYLWFGTWWGLNRYNKATNKFTRFIYNPLNPIGLRSNLIWALYSDSNGMIWIGTDGGGISELNPKTLKFTNFSSDTTNKNHISNDRVFTIFESSDGLMWFGTMDGLNCYNRETGETIVYNKKDGLPDNLINGIQEDKKNYLWIATGNGLSKFNRKKLKFINYNKRNGIKNLEFIQNIGLNSKDGLLYFGSDGLMYFNPDSIEDEYLTSPVVFTDLKIYNKSVPISENGIIKEAISSLKKISVPPGNDVITLDFALLDYGDVRRNSFRYKLKGFDIGWNNVGNRNSATYTNLPPGSYKFIVRASNNNGVKNEKEATLKIIINPEYYQTWWFRVIIGIGIIFITLFIIHGRTRKIARQNKMLENKVAERTKDLDQSIKELSQEITTRKKAEQKVQASLEEKEVLLKEIHHRVKNNLQVISSLLYLQSKSIKDEKTLNLFNDSQNRVKSMALIHEKLYQSRDFAGINFYDYVKGLIEHLNKTFKNNSREVKTNINIDNIKLSLDTAISCGLIVNELITNAHKYAFPQSWIEQKTNKEFRIDINVYNEKNDQYILIVSDNGVGMPENFDIQNTNSLGLKLVNSMINQLGGRIEISNNSGAQFKILFTN